MPDKTKIIFPLDVDRAEKALSLLNEVSPFIQVAKVGLELCHAVGTPQAIKIPQGFSGLEVFADVKLHDIPATVKAAAASIAAHGVDYLNVMALGGEKMMAAAAEGLREKAKELGINRPKLIAVTLLTSHDFADLAKLGLTQRFGLFTAGMLPPHEEQKIITELVLDRARSAVNAGVDCVLSSPWEVEAIRKLWPEIEIICPGIRPPWAPPDDQKRTMTPFEAVMAGANSLVIGRPIRIPPAGMTREDAVQSIVADIDRAHMLLAA